MAEDESFFGRLLNQTIKVMGSTSAKTTLGYFLSDPLFWFAAFICLWKQPGTICEKSFHGDKRGTNVL